MSRPLGRRPSTMTAMATAKAGSSEMAEAAASTSGEDDSFYAGAAEELDRLRRGLQLGREGTELLLRIAHGYALGSASAPPSLAQPQTLDLPALLRAAGLAHQVVEEVTLTGLAEASDAASVRTQWATNGSLLPEGAWRAGPGGGGGGW